MVVYSYIRRENSNNSNISIRELLVYAILLLCEKYDNHFMFIIIMIAFALPSPSQEYK